MSYGRRATMVAGLALLLVTSAAADVIMYNNSTQGLWAARSTNMTSVNLQGLAPEGGYTHYGAFTQDGVTFSTNDNTLFVVSPNWNPAEYTDWGTGYALQQDNWNTLTMSFRPSSSIGFYLNSAFPDGGAFQVSLLLGGQVVATFLVPTDFYPHATFVGFTSTPALFDAVTVVSTVGAITLVSGISYGDDPDPTATEPQIESVPEPGSLWLLGSGLLVMAVLTRHRPHA